jgi:hypothetical protein
MLLVRRASGSARVYLPGENVVPTVEGDRELVAVRTERAALSLQRAHGYIPVQEHAIPKPFAKKDDPWFAKAWKQFLSSNGKVEDVLGSVGSARRSAGVIPVLASAEAAGDVAVVLTLTGWGDEGRDAVERALWVVDDYKVPGSRVVQVIVVQNDPRFHSDLGTLEPRRSLVRVKTANRGFAAACNAGLRRVRKSVDWVLFTQRDAHWDSDEVEAALRIANSVKGSGWSAVVGPSGGFVKGDQVSEIGRNIGQDCGIRQVDFIAGYWLLAAAEDLRKVDGWDDGYFLYYEDPDLCLRLALEGVASVVDTRIRVKHDRSSTIRSGFSRKTKEQIQEWSHERFRRRWGS